MTSELEHLGLSEVLDAKPAPAPLRQTWAFSLVITLIRHEQMNNEGLEVTIIGLGEIRNKGRIKIRKSCQHTWAHARAQRTGKGKKGDITFPYTVQGTWYQKITKIMG